MGRWVDPVAPDAVPEITIPGHAPRPGAQTRAILARCGCSDPEIDEMLRQRIPGEGWSARYRPE